MERNGNKLDKLRKDEIRKAKRKEMERTKMKKNLEIPRPQGPEDSAHFDFCIFCYFCICASKVFNTIIADKRQ